MLLAGHSGLRAAGAAAETDGLTSMTYFTWRESGLTSECSSLEAMAARFEESASLMRRMAEQGFQLERRGNQQRITHPDPTIFEAWGFVSEESPVRQLTLIPDLDA
tara:strand:+ start:74 stop:391 length:318 start_codon:yes stop_codon:yes gene_type:complete